MYFLLFTNVAILAHCVNSKSDLSNSPNVKYCDIFFHSCLTVLYITGLASTVLNSQCSFVSSWTSVNTLDAN